MFNILINNIVSNQGTNNGTGDPDSTALLDVYDNLTDNLNEDCLFWCQPGMSTQDQHTTADFHG